MPRSPARFARRPGEASCMTRSGPGPIFLFATMVLLVALVAPVAAVMVAMPPDEAVRTFGRVGGDALRVSLVASAGATLVAALLGVPAGYYLSGMPARVRLTAIFLLALPLAFPPVASGLMLDLRARHELAVWCVACRTWVERTRFAARRRRRGVLRFRIVRRHRGDGGLWSRRFHLWRCRAHPGRQRMADFHARSAPGCRGKHRRRNRLCVVARNRRVRRHQHRRVSSYVPARRVCTSHSLRRACAKRSRFATDSSCWPRSCSAPPGFCGAETKVARDANETSRNLQRKRCVMLDGINIENTRKEVFYGLL